MSSPKPRAQNHYRVLNINDRNADARMIREAYDRATKAFKVLSNANSRATFDIEYEAALQHRAMEVESLNWWNDILDKLNLLKRWVVVAVIMLPFVTDWTKVLEWLSISALCVLVCEVMHLEDEERQRVLGGIVRE